MRHGRAGTPVLGSSSSVVSLRLGDGVLDALASGRSDAESQQKGGEEARAQDGGAICSEKRDRVPHKSTPGEVDPTATLRPVDSNTVGLERSRTTGHGCEVTQGR